MPNLLAQLFSHLTPIILLILKFFQGVGDLAVVERLLSAALSLWGEGEETK